MRTLQTNMAEDKSSAVNFGERNVVIICECFPPCTEIGGLRPAFFSKFLPKFGWKPIIFTSITENHLLSKEEGFEIDGLPPVDDRIIVKHSSDDQINYYNSGSLFSLGKRFIFPELSQPPGLAEKMIKIGSRVLISDKIDAILATSPPLSMLSVANKISRLLKKPWVADFRDIEEQDFGRYSDLRTKILQMRNLIRRKKIISSASAIVTVSNQHAKILGKKLGRKINVIPNGFDPSMFQNLKIGRYENFSISMTSGRTIDLWYHNIIPFFEALDRFITDPDVDCEDLDISFYGLEEPQLKNLVVPYECNRIVRAKPRIHYLDIPKVLQQSCILLLLANRIPGMLTSKLFEYLAARRPILRVPGSGDELDELLCSTRAGVSCETVEMITHTLKEWYKEWKSTGRVNYFGIEEEITKYSREKQTEHLAKIFDSLIL
jgi:glycosyltransferase involved in cell wall biosynthesis